MHTERTSRNSKRSAGSDPAVQGFMESFGQALSAGDGETISTMWDVPALVVHDGGTRAVSSHEEVTAFFSGAKEQYSRRGIDKAIPEIVSVDWLTERLVNVRVRWPYIDRNGNEIGEESSTYTLRRDNGGELKFVVVTMLGAKEPTPRAASA